MKRMNYTTQFLDDAETNPTTKHHLNFDPKEADKLKELLLRSQKFILPDKGHLLYGPKGLPATAEINRLPFPVIAIEATWEYPKDEGYMESVRRLEEFESNNSSRRLVLAFEVADPMRGIIGRDNNNKILLDRTSILDEAAPEGDRIENPAGYVMLALYRVDAHRTWSLCPAGIYIPYDQNISPSKKSEMEKIEVKNKREVLKLSGVKIESNPMRAAAMPVVALPNMFDACFSEKDWNQVVNEIAHNIGEESRMVIELTMALSCSNVTLTTDTPSALLQKQRKSKKKPPLFDYHVLVINGQEMGEAGVSTGTHGSPRTHLRRGHLRRLPHREERIWINDTIVNPGNGFIEKDYKIRASK